MLTRFEQKEVFVISSNENFHRYVRDNLPDGDFTVSGGAVSCTEARQKMMGNRCAVVIINIPLADECGTELASDLAENTTSSVIVVVKNEQETEFRQSLDRALSGLQADPGLAGRILARERGEKKVKKAM